MDIVKIEDTIKEDVDFSNIYRSKEFTEAMKHFDVTDKLTRNVLLAVNEADQNAVMTSLANKLYSHIVDKIDDIDFGTIPSSKGDITKIHNYDKLVDCIDVMSKLIDQYNQDPKPIEIVREGLDNLIARKSMFELAYKFNIEMPIVIYNTMALTIVSSVSFLISSCVEFIKNSDDTFDIALDKVSLSRTSSSLLYKDLEKFNKMCRTKEFDKAMDYVIKQNQKGFTGTTIGLTGAAIITGIILLIIPVIRELIFFFNYTRSSISEYFEAQANLLEMNAATIQAREVRNDKDKKKIAAKQKKIAEKFRKISNAFRIKGKSADIKAKKDSDDIDNTKYKSSDVIDDIPDSAKSVLF